MSQTYKPLSQKDRKDFKESAYSQENQGFSRRAFLLGTASVIGTAATQALLPVPASSQTTTSDPTKLPGAPASSYGKRSEFEKAHRLLNSARSLTPLQDLDGTITPSALHFERHHNGIPAINPIQHRLLIHGLVKQPMIFTLSELRQFPSVSRLAFIECSGNSGHEWKGPAGRTAQDTHGLTSTSEWTGIPLSTILRETGMKPEAVWMLAEGSDAAALTRSLPLASILDEALLCYAQNGEALRPEQGYPLRLLIPGWEGNTNIKWLRRLKLMTGPAMTREETSKYTDLMQDGRARQFTFQMEAKSVITAPSGGHRLDAPGYVEIRGLAWSGKGRVAQVQVSTDGGQSWYVAALQEPVLPKCHTRFRYSWWWNGKEAILQSRCIDETGYQQPTRTDLIKVRGQNSYYHNNAIQSWKITKEGQVENVQI